MGKIREARRVLKEGFRGVAGIRKMKEMDWVRLWVHIGAGKGSARETKGFPLSRSPRIVIVPPGFPPASRPTLGDSVVPKLW